MSIDLEINNGISRYGYIRSVIVIATCTAL